MEETAQTERETAQQIADNLNKAGHPVNIEDVAPVGDFAYGVGTTVGDALTGSPKVRTAPSRRFLGGVVDRLLKMRKPNEVVVVK